MESVLRSVGTVSQGFVTKNVYEFGWLRKGVNTKEAPNT